MAFSANWVGRSTKESSKSNREASALATWHRRATHPTVQDLHDSRRIGTDQSVVDVLALATRVHQAFLSQHAQLLRQGRLTDAQIGLERTDAELALRQTAQEHQPVGVRHHL